MGQNVHILEMAQSCDCDSLVRYCVLAKTFDDLVSIILSLIHFDYRQIWMVFPPSFCYTVSVSSTYVFKKRYSFALFTLKTKLFNLKILLRNNSFLLTLCHLMKTWWKVSFRNPPNRPPSAKLNNPEPLAICHGSRNTARKS